MIYFFNNDLGLEKVVTSSNTLVGNHEHELNNLIRADVVLDLEHALSFIDDVDFFGYYYKDVFYLHKITRQETEHEAEVMVLAGRHIFFEDMLYSEVIKDIRPQNRDAKYMLDQAIGGHTRWNVVMTDVTGTLSTNFYWQMPYEALEWIVEHFRLEYLPVILFDGQKINGYELHVKKRLGENKGIRIPWGERVEKLNYEIDFSDIVTQLAPRGKGEEIGEDIYSRRINISDVNFSRNGVVSPVGNLYLEDKNLTSKYGNDGGKPRKGEGEFYDIDDVNELAEAGYQMYLDVSRPQVVISADVVDIGDVTIGDGVNIIRREHDLYFEARVHKISVDLLNPDDAQIELGDYEHFKESKVQKSNKKRIDTIEKEFQGIIHQYKIEFDENFDSVVNQWREEQEQAFIDAHAEIQAAEERMETLIESERNTMTDEFNENVQEARSYAEQQAQEKADSVQNNLESFEQTHQQLYDEVTGNIMDIDTFLGDKSMTLAQQFADVESNFSGLQSELSGISEDLGVAKTNLQQQLDDAFIDISDVSGDLSSVRDSLQEQLDDVQEDTEQKITILSESIEYIDGQLEVKLNRTEIEPIQNKITEYGTTLDANAESIGLLQAKTQLHDDDIEQWSNQATSTAEEVSRILTHNSEQDNLITSVTNESRETAEGLERVIGRVSETESGISTAKADIIANADLIGATMTRVDENDRAIGEFQATADGMKADFARYQSDFGEDMSAIQSQVASYEASVDGFRAEVITLQSDIDDVDSWMAEKGAVIDGNADAIRMRVWKNDIDAIDIGGRNIIPDSLNFHRLERTETVTNIFNENQNVSEWHTEDATYIEADTVRDDRRILTSEIKKTMGVKGTWSVYIINEGDSNILIIPNGFSQLDQLWNQNVLPGESRRVVLYGLARDDYDFIQFHFYSDTPIKAYIWGEQFELGNKVTDYSPALEDTEAKITQLNTDVNIEAGRINALLTRTSSAEESIKDINSDVGALYTQVASYEASVDGFRADVGQIEDDMLKEFSVVEQRFDSITNRVSNIKLNTRNMLMGTDFENPNLIRTYTNVDILSRDVGKTIRLGRPGGNEGINTATFMFEESTTLEKDVDYYFVIDYRTYSTPELDYMTINTDDGDWVPLFEHGTSQEGLVGLIDDGTWRKGVMHIRPTSTLSGTLRVGTRFNRGIEGVWIEVKRPYLTNTLNREWVPHPNDGQNIDELVDRITQVEQTSEDIRLVTQELSNDALMRSDILIESNRILIGSQSINSQKLASIIAVSPSAINIITDELNLTGNLNVKGQIESISMDAIEGEFARLWAAEFKAIAIDVNDIYGVTSHFEYLYTLNANIEKLASQTAFINEINALSLNAVHGDITNLRTKLLTSDVIKSRHVNSSMALIDKIFSQSAYIQRLTSKSAFIRDIQSIEITANQLNLNTLTNRINQIEGGLKIKRPDGVDWVRNGQARGHVPVQVYDSYGGSDVQFSGLNFSTRSSHWQTMKYFYTPHEGTRLRVVWGVGLNSGPSASEIVEVRVRTFSNYKPINMGSGTSSRTQMVYNNGETAYITQEIPMPAPTYRQTAAYLEFRRSPSGTNPNNQVRARLLFIGQFD